jgi:hypothetical protein
MRYESETANRDFGLLNPDGIGPAKVLATPGSVMALTHREMPTVSAKPALAMHFFLVFLAEFNGKVQAHQHGASPAVIIDDPYPHLRVYALIWGRSRCVVRMGSRSWLRIPPSKQSLGPFCSGVGRRGQAVEPTPTLVVLD